MVCLFPPACFPFPRTLMSIAAVAPLLLLAGCPSPKPEDSQVSGTISIHGYNIDPSDILVRARPILPEGDPGADGKEAPRIVQGSATRVWGGDSLTYELRLSGLVAETPYRIGLKIANQVERSYPRLVWASDREPLVLAGESRLHFDAYAVLSELEVLGSAEARGEERWVAADGLDFSDPDRSARLFRWRTSIPGVTGGELQVSIKPFPRVGRGNYAACDEPDDGVIYREEFEAIVGEWAPIPPIDFNAILVGHRADAGIALRANDDPYWDAEVLPRLEAGMPIYVRVVPRIGDDPICDSRQGGVVPEVLLASILASLTMVEPDPVSDPKVELGTVWYTKPDYDTRPGYYETCYRVTKDHKILSFGQAGFTVWDMLAANHMSGVGYGGVAKRGKGFCVPPSSGDDDGWVESFFDSFGSVLTGVIDGIGQLVNYTANLWEEIQDAVVDVAASAVDSVGIIDCGQGSTCRAALETGLEIGLASMGLPPSLPNFEELIDHGVDYLAAQVAAQAGVPSVVADYASDKAQKFVKEVVEDLKKSHSMPGLPDWLVADLRFEPAVLTVEVYGQGKTQPFKGRPGVIRKHTSVYSGAFIQLPRHLPKKGVEPPLVFPMALPPNADDLPEPPPLYTYMIWGEKVTVYPSEYQRAIWYKQKWLDLRYKNGCYHVHLVALSDPGGIYELISSNIRADDYSAACK